MPTPDRAESPQGSDVVLGSFGSNEALARAVAIGVPSFVRRARAVEEAMAQLESRIQLERNRMRKALGPLPAGPPATWRPAERRRLARSDERWRNFLERVPLGDVHAAQEAYNKFYAIEREMALPGAPRIAVPPLQLLDRAELIARFAPLVRPE